MAYIDGFVLPLNSARLEEYRRHAELFAREARKFGAVSVEALGDGLELGKRTSFPRSVEAQEGEDVVFSFVIWPDKDSRDKGWEAVMSNPELDPGEDMPFDGKRMFWGGFTPLVGEDALSALLAFARTGSAAAA